jgi:hypothetical protein
MLSSSSEAEELCTSSSSTTKTSKSTSTSTTPSTTVAVSACDGGLITLLNHNDVLCGRGGRVNSHCGNVKFRQLVSELRGTYLSKTTKKLDKVKIADKIVNAIRGMDPPGRFLKESDVDTEDGWYDIGDFKASKKAGQAMRETGNNQRIRPPTPPPSSTEAADFANPGDENEYEQEDDELLLRERQLPLRPHPQPQRIHRNFSLIQALQNEQSIYCPPLQPVMSAALPLQVPSSTNVIDSRKRSRKASLLGMLLNNVHTNTNANNQQTAIPPYQPLYSMPPQQQLPPPPPPMIAMPPMGIDRRRLFLELLKNEPSRLPPPPPPPQTILDCEVIAMMQRHNRRRLL